MTTPPRRRAPGWAAVLGSPVLGPVVAVLLGAGLLGLARPLLAAPSTTPVTVEDARMVYLRDCSVCHAPDGLGTSVAPTLAGQGAAGTHYSLSTGRMPISSPSAEVRRREPAYSPEMIAALAAYVDHLVPGGPAIPVVDTNLGDLGRGGSIYREQCAACHQAAGEGGALLDAESPSLAQATPEQVVEAMRTGPGNMPVFGEDAVSTADANSVARYVVGLQDPEDPGGLSLWHLGPLTEGAAALAAMGIVIIALRRIGGRT